MKNKVTGLLLLTLLLIGCLFSITGCSSSTPNKPSEKSSNAETVVETTEKESESEPEKKNEPEIVYADDEVVNSFIAEYNKISKSPLEDIEKGNVRTKYFASSHGYWLEILYANDTDKIKVSINVTNDTAEEGVAGMREVFHDVVKAIEPPLSDDEIYTYFENLVNNEYMVTDDIFSTKKVTYVPDKELSGGHSRGRIDVRTQ